jgi:flagellar assembly protein FliH
LSRLVTSEELASAGRPLATLNLCDIEQKARQAIEQARSEAKRILSETVARVREIERVAAARGEKAGFDAGRAKGLEAGRLEAVEAETRRIADATETLREALMEMIGQVEGNRHEVIADAQHGLLGLSVAIADRLCRARVCQTTEHLRPLMEEVIDTTGCQSGLVLRVNPADASAIETFLADLFATVTGDVASAVRVIADESISRGGCIAQRSTGRTDARIETQIKRIVAELLGTESDDETPAGDPA